VTSLRPGEAVFGVVTKPALGDGAFGEYITAPVAYTARVPAGLDLAAAGALGLAARLRRPPSTRWPGRRARRC
jgi:NADPH:quinone reductase